MKKIIVFGLVVILSGFLFLIPKAKADVLIPTKTKYYFSENGQPINEPVDFNIDCFGYSTGIPPVEKKAGTYIPKKVHSISHHCSEYGCEFDEQYYFNYVRIDYCTLTGKTANKQFTINNIGELPYSTCKSNGLINSDGSGISESCDLDVNISNGTSKPINSTLIFLCYLLISIISETLVIILLIKYAFKTSQISNLKIAIAGVVPTLITSPIANLFLTQLFSGKSADIIIESVVVIVETFLLALILKIGVKKSFIVSLIANIASYLIGLALTTLI